MGSKSTRPAPSSHKLFLAALSCISELHQASGSIVRVSEIELHEPAAMPAPYKRGEGRAQLLIHIPLIT